MKQHLPQRTKSQIEGMQRIRDAEADALHTQVEAYLKMYNIDASVYAKYLLSPLSKKYWQEG